jgi:hypothetical protein
MNDIVTTSGDVLPTLCTLHVGPNELRIIAAPGVLMTINHESCEQGILIDQDVVSVGSVTFFYIGLGGADAGH